MSAGTQKYDWTNWHWWADQAYQAFIAQPARLGAGLGAGQGQSEEQAQQQLQAGSKAARQPTAVPSQSQASAEAGAHPLSAPIDTVKSALGAGDPNAPIRHAFVWVIIALVAVIGVWGLVSPGGGIAVVERAVTGRRR